MPRDGSGVYSLPVGNPVVTNTIIASTWANSTMSDIAAQLNNVLTRDGLLGPTSPFKLADGTVPAPGLAFNSEPGLGMYRPAAGHIGWAGVGGQFMDWQTVDPAVAALKVFPRAAGQSQFQLHNQPVAATDKQILYMAMAPTTAVINVLPQGSAPKLPLGFDASAFNFGGGTVYAPAFYLTGSVFGLSLDANAFYQGYAAGWYWSAARATGVLAYQPPGSGPASSFSPNGQFSAGGKVISNGGNGPSMWFDGANGNYLSMQGGSAGTWSWVWDRTSGALSWVGGAAGASVFGLDGNGHVTAAGNVTGQTGLYAGLFWKVVKEANIIRQYFNNNASLRFDCDVSTGTFQIVNPAGTWTFRNDAIFIAPSGAYKPGGGAWSDSSDERIKDGIEDYTTGLDAVLALRPRRYHYRAETKRDVSKEYIGLIAQEAIDHMPETITVAPGNVGDIELDDLHTFDSSAIIYALINAIKELHERLSHLETQPA